MENENKNIRKIKKYANRKLYDTTEKKYITFDELSELIKAGEEVLIEDNETGENITASVVAQLLARENKENTDEAPSGILIQLLRKGGDTVANYTRKYTGLWQNAVTMAEDEIDKLVNVLVKSKEISETEGTKLKKEILNHTDNLKTWISNKVDQRVKEALSVMNLATKDQVLDLTKKIEALTIAVEKLEQMNIADQKPLDAVGIENKEQEIGKVSLENSSDKNEN